MYDTDFLYGFVVGLIISIILIVLIYKKVILKSGNKLEFDERQMAIRGQCYKIAFFVCIFYMMFYALIMEINTELFLMIGPMGIFAGVFLSIGVFASLCIWKDAYQGINESSRWKILFPIMALVNLGIAYSGIQEYGWIEEGCVNMNVMNLECGILFLVIICVQLIKNYKDRSEEE